MDVQTSLTVQCSLDVSSFSVVRGPTSVILTMLFFEPSRLLTVKVPATVEDGIKFPSRFAGKVAQP